MSAAKQRLSESKSHRTMNKEGTSSQLVKKSSKRKNLKSFLTTNLLNKLEGSPSAIELAQMSPGKRIKAKMASRKASSKPLALSYIS